MNKAIVDLDTGEVDRYLEAGDRVVTGKSMDHLKTTMKMPVESFAKLNQAELQLLLPSLTHMEQAMLINLSPYISYKTCCLQYQSGNDLSLKDIIRVTGVSESACSKAIDGLIKKDILYKGRNSKNNQYFVNPWIASKGQVVNKVLKQMFKNYKVLSIGGARWRDIPDFK